MSARKPHVVPGFVFCIVDRQGRYWNPRRRLAGSPNTWVDDRTPWTDYVSLTAVKAAYTRLGLAGDRATKGVGGPAHILKFPVRFDPPRKSPSRGKPNNYRKPRAHK